MDKLERNKKMYLKLAYEIREIIHNARNNIAKTINNQLLETYWYIGRLIVENEHKNKIHSTSARQIILELSKILTKELGKGFSRANLFNMRKFFLEYRNVQTVSGQLSWSHYCELLLREDKEKRAFYTKKSINSKWSIRELKRQINSSLYERLLLSKGEINKKTVLELSENGVEITKAEDIIRSPYVFEFLGVPENKPLLEKDLELKLIRHIEDFLLELGKGFMFVGAQQRITIKY